MSNNLRAVRCKGCGGAVAARPEHPLPTCLFCGAPAIQLVEEEAESVEQPEAWIPFAQQSDDATAAFKTFAQSSIWYPNDLRKAKLELRRLLLPAWAFAGDLETHWTGLVKASTRSGKRPVSGDQRVHMDQVLVPASPSLTLAELAQLGRYDESALATAEPAEIDDPMELPEMTRSVARQAAQTEMQRRHRTAIADANATTKLITASVCTALDGRPVLVPVYIGAFRYRDVAYRILINGQTGVLVGKAPISWYKVAAAVFAGILAIGAIAAAISLCMGGVSILSMILR